MPPLLADFTHARPCKPFCEKYLTLPRPPLKMPPLLADFTHARPCKPFCEKYLTLPFEIRQADLAIAVTIHSCPPGARFLLDFCQFSCSNYTSDWPLWIEI